MVHVKRLELTRFKSFGSTTSIPLLPGFTTISGPNGSGKSNILDALLFALGLANSRGMRAERLPDLVNHGSESNNGNGNGNGKRYVHRRETTVTVTFDISDLPEEDTPKGRSPEGEWSVTRRLRVNKEGGYSSTYYINGETCTQTELHEALHQLRIYPEGYNVVLQGDVTRIITMNARERREIIDELAGVAEFDRKIARARDTLETVKEREDRCRILETELVRTRDRAAADARKAEKYKQLKGQIQTQQQQEIVLKWRSLQQQEERLQAQIKSLNTEIAQSAEQQATLERQIATESDRLAQLNQQVKALGEDDHLAAASKLATQQAQQTQLQQQQQDLARAATTATEDGDRARAEIETHQQSLAQLQQEREQHLATRPELLATQERAQQELTASKAKATEIASAADDWVRQQTALSRQVTALQNALQPQQTECAQLAERQAQLHAKCRELQAQRDAIAPELSEKETAIEQLVAQTATSEKRVQEAATTLSSLEEERHLQQTTQTRLLTELRQKERQLDKLEATTQAQKEAQGSYATQTIFQADIPGVCGLVAQLGAVEAQYQLALETAAGGRLANVVVEDDAVAAVGIELLKKKRAGRATFLPLTKIRSPRLTRSPAISHARGFIDYAVELVECDPKYRLIFAYVFGNTAVFNSLAEARPHLGSTRIVTLEGELLESSGAMSGGSQSSRSSLHFGMASAGESPEAIALRQRLQEIQKILQTSETQLSAIAEKIQTATQTLTSTRQDRQEQQWHLKQAGQDLQRLQAQNDATRTQLETSTSELESLDARLQMLDADIPQREAELSQLQEQLAALEASSQAHGEWQTIQTEIQSREAQLATAETALRNTENQLQTLDARRVQLEANLNTAQQRSRDSQQQQEAIALQQTELQVRLSSVATEITDTQADLERLATQLGETKRDRDLAETTLQTSQQQQQQLVWKQQQLAERRDRTRDQLAAIVQQRQIQETELPDPIPELPAADSDENSSADFAVQLTVLQGKIRQNQKRLEAMEPVNMLALEEYENARDRLQDLTEKLTTLDAERSELLLRIETFTTRRQQAFQEAFDVVNANFQTIFASLSEGEGHLQLDDAENQSEAGLNLIARPKGKPVRRLQSMSGGEKSLTALSFIFALQRYRPSPFYAFDEVDMFLDGANVERLAKTIREQAKEAQFIVVSLRRPTLEAADRTIGVTQARGAYTQVLGIKL